MAADHLNALGSTPIAILNLEVGRKSMNVAAFVPALSYLERGLDALQRSTVSGIFTIAWHWIFIVRQLRLKYS